MAQRVTKLRERAQEQRLIQVGGQLSSEVCCLIPRSLSVGGLPTSDLKLDFVIEAIIGDLITMVVGGSQGETLRLCHQCHTPLSDIAHSGIPSGVGRCNLEHWQGCKGGIKGGKGKNGKDWASCSPIEGSQPSDSESDQESLDSTLDGHDKLEELPPTVEQAAALLQNSLEKQFLPAKDAFGGIDDDLSSEDEDLLQQKQEFERLERLVQNQAAANKDRELIKKREVKKLKVSREKQILAEKMKLLREKQAALILESQALENSSLQESVRTKDKILKDKVAEYEARKARQTAAKASEIQKDMNDGLLMAGIRALPDVRKEVEDYMTRLKSATPTLSSDPTATGFTSTTFQPEGVLDRGTLASSLWLLVLPSRS